jgi:hypothetical protein
MDQPTGVSHIQEALEYEWHLHKITMEKCCMQCIHNKSGISSYEVDYCQGYFLLITLVGRIGCVFHYL